MSPRTDEQNEQLKDERREQILAAAVKVFATHGFAAAKIGGIVAEAGISHGLFYHYFKSKEEIFGELVARAVYYSGQSLVMVDAMPLSPIQKVRQTAEMILGSIVQGNESSYYFMIMIHASVIKGQENTTVNLADGDLPVKIMQKILAEGQQAGQIRDGDVFEMSVMFFAAIMGLAIYKLSMPDFRMPDSALLVDMLKIQ